MILKMNEVVYVECFRFSCWRPRTTALAYTRIDVPKDKKLFRKPVLMICGDGKIRMVAKRSEM